MGSTWGSYVQKLDSDAAYITTLGENDTNVNNLWALELQQANGFGPVQTLASSTDMSVSVPGLPLSISRSFSSTVPLASSLLMIIARDGGLIVDSDVLRRWLTMAVAHFLRRG